MATVIRVEDPDDDRLADYRHLSDAALRRDVRGRTAPHGRFIVEGHLAVGKLLDSAYPVVSLLASDQQWPRLATLLDDKPSAFPCYVATQEVLDATVGFRLHRGVVASAARLPADEPLTMVAEARLVAVLEGVNDHENLGGLFRNAAAFGVDAVLLDPTCADPLYRRAVRVSLGHVLHVPFARFDRAAWPGALAGLEVLGFTSVALTPRPGAEPLDDLVVSPPDRPAPRWAVLLGAEGHGLSEATLASAVRRVRIPLAAGVDSLNVSVAAAVAFHHLRRAAVEPGGTFPSWTSD